MKYQERYWKTKKCKICNKVIHYRRSLLKNSYIPTFCSKVCQGKHLGTLHGYKSGKSPNDAKSLLKIFPGDFTVMDFAKKFGYIGFAQTWKRMKLLTEAGIIKKHGRSKDKNKPELYKVIKP